MKFSGTFGNLDVTGTLVNDPHSLIVNSNMFDKYVALQIPEYDFEMFFEFKERKQGTSIYITVDDMETMFEYISNETSNSNNNIFMLPKLIINNLMEEVNNN